MIWNGDEDMTEIYDIILKEIKDYVEKCGKPNYSSNVHTTLPSEYDILNNWDVWNYRTQMLFLESEFIESDKYSNTYTNLEQAQVRLQERTCDFSLKEESYLSEYFGNGYKWINGILYDSPSFYNHFTKTLIDQYEGKINTAKHHIDRAMAKGTQLRQNTVLYSSLRLEDGIKVGEVGQWKGYISTSFDKEQMLSNTKKDYNVKILALKGVKGICGQGGAKHLTDEGYPRKLSGHPAEQEFLLARNTNYLVLRKDDENREATVLVY